MITGLLTQSDLFGLIFMAVAIVVYLIWRARQSQKSQRPATASLRSIMLPAIDSSPRSFTVHTFPHSFRPDEFAAATSASLNHDQPNRHVPPPTDITEAVKEAFELAKTMKSLKPATEEDQTCPITLEKPNKPVDISINGSKKTYDLNNLYHWIVNQRRNTFPGFYENPITGVQKVTVSSNDSNITISITLKPRAQHSQPVAATP